MLTLFYRLLINLNGFKIVIRKMLNSIKFNFMIEKVNLLSSCRLFVNGKKLTKCITNWNLLPKHISKLVLRDRDMNWKCTSCRMHRYISENRSSIQHWLCFFNKKKTAHKNTQHEMDAKNSINTRCRLSENELAGIFLLGARSSVIYLFFWIFCFDCRCFDRQQPTSIGVCF